MPYSRFILCDAGDVYEHSLDQPDTEVENDAKHREQQRRAKLLEQVNFDKYVIIMCSCTSKILCIKLT